ncbi:MAG TPA: hypothetical protein V6D23_11855 [Candidatus Obscuribacterales bacterium]
MSKLPLISAVLICLILTACSPPAGTNPNNPPASASPQPSPGAATPSPGAAIPSPGAATPVPSDANALSLSKISTVAGGGKDLVPEAKDGSLSEARFQEPTGVVADASGNLYVTDEGSNTIRKITAQGVSTLAGTGKPGYKDGPGNEAQFSDPWDLVLDAQGNLYVADSGNHRIRKITPDGTVSTVAGSGKNDLNDGPALEADFFNPTGLDRDAQGNFYVADQTNNVIRKISASGQVSTLAGSPDGTSGLTDGKGAAAMFRRPTDVLMTARGLYVADDGNHAIRLIAADGTVTTLVGRGARSQGNQDGSSATAELNGPASLTADRAGNIYFVEFNGNTVRRMNPAGDVTTLISGIPGGFVDGSLAIGKVNAPTGIFCDGKVLFVADRDNHRIRKLD